MSPALFINIIVRRFVKVVFGIPRPNNLSSWIYLRHLGIYAYRKQFLLEITQKKQTQYEICEKLEQLRVLENGYSIITGKVDHAWTGIDTPEQYAEFVKRYMEKS